MAAMAASCPISFQVGLMALFNMSVGEKELKCEHQPTGETSKNREWSNWHFTPQEVSDCRGYCLNRSDHDYDHRSQFSARRDYCRDTLDDRLPWRYTCDVARAPCREVTCPCVRKPDDMGHKFRQSIWTSSAEPKQCRSWLSVFI